ncbi:MAG: hypothetical protein ABSH20_23050 [Tepidisphaeraceae bacterium]|jgi:hypothetical protein
MARFFANMGNSIVKCTVLLGAVLFLFTVSGCTHNTDDDVSIENRYFEVTWKGTIYVTSNILAIDQVRADKPMKMSIKSRGANGVPIEVEDDGKALGIRLLAEYDRRHGINR